MGEIASWNGHKFEVKSGFIQGFTDLTLKGSSETEDKDESSQKYVSRKNGKPVEISLTAHLNALTGCTDVQGQAVKFVTEARSGSKNYFYVNGKKLLSCQLMLTDATVKEIGMANNGKWTRADIQLTLKQCTKNDGSTGGGSSGGGGGGGGGGGSTSSGSTNKTYKVQIPGMSVVTVTAASVQAAINKAGCGSWTGTVYVNGTSYYVVKGVISQKPSTTTTTNKTTNVITNAVNTVKNTVKNAITTATNFINNLVNTAKKASTTAKTTTTTTTKATPSVTIKKPSTKFNLLK